MNTAGFVTVSIMAALGLIGLACNPGSGVVPTPTPTPTSDFSTYINESDGFSISYPMDWYVDLEICRRCGGPLIAFLSPQPCANYTTRFEVRNEQLAEQMSVQEYLEMKRQDLDTSMDEYVPISEEEVTVGGRAAIKHVFTAIYGTNAKFIALGLVEDKTGWYMYSISNASCASECETVFDTMVGSFQLLK